MQQCVAMAFMVLTIKPLEIVVFTPNSMPDHTHKAGQKFTIYILWYACGHLAPNGLMLNTMPRNNRSQDRSFSGPFTAHVESSLRMGGQGSSKRLMLAKT